MSDDPFSTNQFDSGSIDLTNPSEIFQFEKDDLSCGKETLGLMGDEPIQLQQIYHDFNQVNQTAFVNKDTTL